MCNKIMGKARRKVGIHSHQFYTEGWFVGYGQKGGDLYIFIESNDGWISKYNLMGTYSAVFKSQDEGV